MSCMMRQWRDASKRYRWHDYNDHLTSHSMTRRQRKSPSTNTSIQSLRRWTTRRDGVVAKTSSAQSAAEAAGRCAAVASAAGKAEAPRRPFRRIQRIGLARRGAAHNSVVTVPSSDGLATRVASTYCTSVRRSSSCRSCLHRYRDRI